jgi:hypothetical protein
MHGPYNIKKTFMFRPLLPFGKSPSYSMEGVDLITSDTAVAHSKE